MISGRPAPVAKDATRKPGRTGIQTTARMSATVARAEKLGMLVTLLSSSLYSLARYQKAAEKKVHDGKGLH